jgi:hypothetical protein
MNRRVSLTGISTDAPGRGAETKYHSRAEIIKMPSGSIVSIPPLKSSDLPKSGLNEPLLLGILFSLDVWLGIALGIRALFF